MRITIGIFMLMIMVGCESLADKQLQSQNANVIAVDANITSENKNHLVTLSFPYKTQNGIGLPVSGAIVTLTAGADLYSLAEEPAGSGKYFTPALRAITGTIYTLTIIYQGKSFAASDSPPVVEAMTPLATQKVDSLYQIISNAEGDEPNFIRYQIVWQDTPFCAMANSCAGEIYYYDLKSADVNDIFKPGKQDFDFPPGSTVIRTKYSVSPGYRSFLRSMLSETEWRGGVFDVQRDNVETNVEGGAVGFFAVSTVISDTTVVN